MALLLFLFSSFLVQLVCPLTAIAGNPCSSKGDPPEFNNSGIHLTLYHARGPCSPLTLPLLNLSDILHGDEARIRTLHYRLTKKTITSSSRPDSSEFRPKSVGVPLTPGKSVGTGNYVLKIGIGTPPKYYVMVMDTGSSLTWLQCQPCRIECHSQVGEPFDPSLSPTYKSVSCNAVECTGLQAATLNPSKCSNRNTCIYAASYGDSSFSVGYLSRDTLTVAPAQTLPGFVFGCGQDNEGLFGQSAGLVGLARNRLSLLSQLSPKFGYGFSYCLPTPSSGGFLKVGLSGQNPSMYEFTPMRADSRDSSLYFIRLTGITVAGKALPISSMTYTRSPTIIDSGTVITRLPETIYTALQEAFVKAMSRYAKAPPVSILDTCFKGSSQRMTVPAFALIFEGGTAMKLGARNVLFDMDDGTTCLAFATNSGAGAISIIGNHQQQTFNVLYDVANSRIGFAASGCG